MSSQYPKKESSYEVDVLHADKHESFLQVDSNIFDGFGKIFPYYLGKFIISLWHLRKKVRNEVRDLTVVAGPNTTLTICDISDVLPPLILFLSQCGIHTKPFFIWLNVCVTYAHCCFKFHASCLVSSTDDISRPFHYVKWFLWMPLSFDILSMDWPIPVCISSQAFSKRICFGSQYFGPLDTSRKNLSSTILTFPVIIWP